MIRLSSVLHRPMQNRQIAAPNERKTAIQIPYSIERYIIELDLEVNRRIRHYAVKNIYIGVLTRSQEI